MLDGTVSTQGALPGALNAAIERSHRPEFLPDVARRRHDDDARVG